MNAFLQPSLCSNHFWKDFKKRLVFAALLMSWCCNSMIHAQTFGIVVHVRAHDGTPLQQSHASLTRNSVGSVKNIPSSATDGNSYAFSVDKPGTYWIRVAGTHHRAFRGPVLIEDDTLTEFEVRLGTLSANMRRPDSVFLSGTFNASGDSGLERMTRQKDGSYSALIESPKEVIHYRPLVFSDGEGIPVDAPGSEGYRYDSTRFTVWASGNYYTIVRSRGKKKIIFEPKSLLTSDLPAQILFQGPAKPAAVLLTSYAKADFRIMKFRLAQYAFLETHQMGNDSDFLNAYDVESEVGYFSAMAAASTDRLAQDVWNVGAFHFTPYDSSRAVEVADSLPIDARIWSVGYVYTWPLLNTLPRAKAAILAEQIAEAQKDPAVKAPYLEFALEQYHKMNEEHLTRLYNTSSGQSAFPF